VKKKKLQNFNSPAPILLFTYKRLQSLKRLIISLKTNREFYSHELFIFSDAAKKKIEINQVKRVRNYIKKIKGFKKITIYLRKKNIGLEKNITYGVSKIIKKKKKVIVLEDDLFLSKNFLNYMNNSLKNYEKKRKVWHISGWNYNFRLPKTNADAFFGRYMNCWGWATWHNRWKYYEKNPDKLISKWNNEDIKKFNLDGSYNYWSQVLRNHKKIINTWAIFWYATIFKKKGLCLNPTSSLVINFGEDSFSTNVNKNIVSTNIKIKQNNKIIKFPKKIEENKRIIDFIKSKIRPNFLKKVFNKIIGLSLK